LFDPARSRAALARREVERSKRATRRRRAQRSALLLYGAVSPRGASNEQARFAGGER
jgi:hypothetical protein